MVKKNVSEPMLAANRANSKKSTGLVTDRGKSVVRFNAAKHWGRAETMRELLPALGEHAEDFAEQGFIEEGGCGLDACAPNRLREAFTSPRVLDGKSSRAIDNPGSDAAC